MMDWLMFVYYTVGVVLWAGVVGYDLGKTCGLRPLDLLAYGLLAAVWPLWIIVAVNIMMRNKMYGGRK